MNFFYHPISQPAPQMVPISLAEIATNVITDWMPGTPVSLSRGFADLLGEVLETQSFGARNLWTVKPVADRFEKQWKQMTSWILGVAFCRKVIEIEGYPWWAPVSAFTKRNNVLASLTPYWIQDLAQRHCCVRLPSPPLSNLMPDYILARFSAADSCYEISFAESKGCKSSLKSLSAPPHIWRNQSRNAEFLYRNVLYPCVQNIVVATRVNPGAKKPITRQIHVRAWNSRSSSVEIPFAAFRSVLSLHYFGICERIGLPANARQIEMTRLLECGIPLSLLMRDPAFVDVTREKLAEAAHEELEKAGSGRLPQEPIYTSPRRSVFTIADRNIRIGLSEGALGLIRWLQTAGAQSGDQLILRFTKEIKLLRSHMDSIEGVTIRSDGVIGEFVD